MISLLGLVVAVAIIAVFGRVVSEAFGRAQNSERLNPRDEDYRVTDRGVAPERSQTEDLNQRSSGGQLPAPPPVSTRATREQRMQELKRLYVEDQITVEEYEAELDKLMRPE